MNKQEELQRIDSAWSSDDPVVQAIQSSVKLPLSTQMNKQDLKGYTSADVVRVILQFINKRLARDVQALNDEWTMTDGGNDVAQILKGRTDAYVAVKYFIESGLREVAG